MAHVRGFGIVVVFSACAAGPAATPGANSAIGAPVTAAAFPSGAPQPIRSHTLDFPLELSLPGKPSWRITDGPSWLEAEHASSSSKLALRTWRAERLVRWTDCASQARLGRPSIPTVRDEALVDRRAFAAPAGFDSELVVGVEPGARGDGVTGYAVVFGASVGRCYAAVFTTSVTGAAAEQEIASRLGLVVDRIFGSVRIRSVDERAPRRHLVATPE